MKLKPGDPIHVIWEDACSTAGWREPYKQGVLVENVGVFVSQTKKGLCMARGWEKPEVDQVLGPNFIPKGMLRKIRKLR